MWLTQPFRSMTGGHPGGGALAAALLLAPAMLESVMLGPVMADPPAALAQAVPIELLALNGFDPVSYFLDGGPLPGSARYELSWGGLVWRFRGAADRAAFHDAPAVYAPRLGGHDAAGILDGRLVEADPLVFAVIDGRLYLFRDADRRARFLADPGLARRAEAAWPALRGLADAPPAGDAP